MRWRKNNLWRAGIAIGALLLLLLLTVWIPALVAGAYEGASGLATPGTGTVQVSPTVDPTMTALEKEKLAQEIDQLKNQNYWAWTTIGPILVGFAGLFAALYSFVTWIRNRQDEQKKRDEEQKRWLEDRQAERERRNEEQQRWLKDQEAEREKRAEERFQAAVEGLSSEREEAKIGAAILLRTFLRPRYEQFYIQTFDLAVANLRLPRSPRQLGEPDVALPLTTLSQALIVVFKEAFPLARSQETRSLQPLDVDATSIQLDNAYLRDAHLEQVCMPQASLQKANLAGANLAGANLAGANLTGANLTGANLTGANLTGADLSGAKLIRAELNRANLNEATLFGAELFGAKLNEARLVKAILNGTKLNGADLNEANLHGADLSRAKLNGAKFSRADLSGAKLHGANPEEASSLKDTNLRGVKGLTKEQLATCKAKGAIIDEDAATSSPQSRVSPPLPSQENDGQVPSAPPAQRSNPTPDMGGSSATSPYQGSES